MTKIIYVKSGGGGGGVNVKSTFASVNRLTDYHYDACCDDIKYLRALSRPGLLVIDNDNV